LFYNTELILNFFSTKDIQVINREERVVIVVITYIYMFRVIVFDELDTTSGIRSDLIGLECSPGSVLGPLLFVGEGVANITCVLTVVNAR